PRPPGGGPATRPRGVLAVGTTPPPAPPHPRRAHGVPCGGRPGPRRPPHGPVSLPALVRRLVRGQVVRQTDLLEGRHVVVPLRERTLAGDERRQRLVGVL